MMVLQVELTSGITKRVCWIDKNVSVGDAVTIRKDEPLLDGLLWEVTAVYASTDITKINRHWNNNI